MRPRRPPLYWVKHSLNTLPRIVTSRHAPDSYQSAASPLRWMGCPPTRSKRFDSHTTLPGVVKSVARGVESETTLREKTTDGCQRAFSTASPALYCAGTGSASVSSTSVGSCHFTSLTTVSIPGSNDSTRINRNRSPGRNVSKPNDSWCIYLHNRRSDDITFSIFRQVE